MGDFALILGAPLNAKATALRTMLGRRVRTDGGWRWTSLAPDIVVAVTGQMSFGRRAADLVWVGDLFPQPETTGSPLAPLDRLRAMVADHWGRYVAAARGQDGAWSILRDPSGAIDCAVWERDGLLFAASLAPTWLDPALPNSEIDDAAVASLLRDPTATFSRTALRGFTALNPGECFGAGDVTALWSPGAVIRKGAIPRQEGLQRFPDALDHGLAVLAAGRGPLLVEVSGGFDSAVVAATTARVAGQAVAGWLNLRSRDVQGDERPYARAVTERIGAALVELEKPPGLLDLALLRAHAIGFRPALGSIDQTYDSLIAQHGAAIGAKALVTGQGGDTVFFQPPSALIAVDYMQALGGVPWLGGPMLGLARRRRQSIWRLAWRAYRTPRNAPLRASDGDAPAAFVHPERLASDAPLPHPWLSNLDGISPAKRLQVLALILQQRRLGPSSRAATLDILDPLLAQPVVEIGLGLASYDLALDGRDRGLARLAFADRLPSTVLERQGKGSGGTWFGQMVNASLPGLRPLLLEGELAARRIVDRNTLEMMLDPNHLIAQGGYLEILDAAALEMWLRGWAERLSTARRQTQA